MVTMIQKKFILKAISFCLLLLFISSNLLAQNTAQIAKGNVSDLFGNPLAGVMIHTKASKNAGLTDIDGNFSIAIEEGIESISFSYLGYSAT